MVRHHDTRVAAPVFSTPAASMDHLEEEACRLRASKARQSDGRYAPRYPGLFVPPIPAGFDRNELRERIAEAIKPGKRYYFPDFAERLGMSVDDTRDRLAVLTWYGLGWSTDDAKYTVLLSMLTDAEWLKAHDAKMQCSWVLHTPDGGSAFGAVTVTRVEVG